MYNPHDLYRCEEDRIRKKRKGGIADLLMTAVGVIASFSNAPQIIKIWQTGQANDLSLVTYLIALVAVTSWFFYGLYIKNKPLIITAFISIVLLSTVVAQILIYAS